MTQSDGDSAFEHRGRSIALNDSGHGATVLLLHSSGLGATQWHRLALRLRSRFRVVVPHLLGYGDSASWPEDEPFDYSVDLEVLQALATSRLARPFHIVGHSYGAFLALALARSDVPVSSLVLYEPVAFGVLASMGDEEGLQDLRTLPAHNEDAHSNEDLERWLSRFMDYWNGRGAWSSFADSQRTLFRRSARKLYQEVQSLINDKTPHTAYEAVRAPALLLSGERTTPAARRVCDLLAATLPCADHVVIRGAGHMGPLTHAPEVNERVVEYLVAMESRSDTDLE